MSTRWPSTPQVVLLIGDTVVLLLVTLFGFASHGTLGTAGSRMLTTFLPLLAGWLLIAPHLGVFDPNRAARWQELWRPFWAAILAAPLSAWLRGVLLGAAVLPLFVVVMGGFSSLALLAWRAIYSLARARVQKYG